MAHKITPQQMAAVAALDGPDRYKHFIKRVADCGEAWGLHDATGWAIMGDDKNAKSLPLWPHPEYAQAFATGLWTAYKPTSINLADRLTKWLPGLARDGITVAIFPIAPTKGIIVEPLRLKHDLEEECRQYE